MSRRRATSQNAVDAGGNACDRTNATATDATKGTTITRVRTPRATHGLPSHRLSPPPAGAEVRAPSVIDTSSSARPVPAGTGRLWPQRPRSGAAAGYDGVTSAMIPGCLSGSDRKRIPPHAVSVAAGARRTGVYRLIWRPLSMIPAS